MHNGLRMDGPTILKIGKLWKTNINENLLDLMCQNVQCDF